MNIDLSMIQNLDTIFHYTKMNVAIEHILGESRLRLSRGFNTHDPREYGKWNLCPHLEGNAISDRDFSREWHKAEIALNDVTRSYKFASFCCNDRPEKRTDLDISSGDVGRSGYNRLRMWAQYGESFYGICIAFSAQALREKLFKRIGEKFPVYLDRVRYDGNMAINDHRLTDANANEFVENEKTEWANRFVKNNIGQIFFKKHTDFADENEYRIVVYDPCDSFENEPLDVKNCIKAVILGDRFKEVYVKIVKSLCKQHDIGFSKLSWECGQLKMKDFDS